MQKNVSKVFSLSMKRIKLFSLYLLFSAVMTSCSSHQPPAGSLVDGNLRPCPDRPNCLNSQQHGDRFVAPLEINGETTAVWSAVERIVINMGGKIEAFDETYLWATFRTPLFRFVDDLELFLDKQENVIHIRSGSRIGYSDLGVNSKRVEKLRANLHELTSPHP